MRNSTFLGLLLLIIAGAAILLVARDGQEILGLADHQFADLVYLGAWGSVLAVVVVGAARLRPGRALLSALAWVALFAGLVLAYSFAGEAQGLRDRLVAALLPGTAVSQGADGERQVMVMRGLGRHFRVDAELNGIAVPLLVDTGASVVAIDRATAERIGIDLASLAYTSSVRTANGVVAAAPVRIDRLVVGEIERRNVQAVVTEGSGIGIDLLGMSFLGTLSSVDFRRDRLVLTE